MSKMLRRIATTVGMAAALTSAAAVGAAAPAGAATAPCGLAALAPIAINARVGVPAFPANLPTLGQGVQVRATFDGVFASNWFSDGAAPQLIFATPGDFPFTLQVQRVNSAGTTTCGPADWTTGVVHTNACASWTPGPANTQLSRNVGQAFGPTTISGLEAGAKVRFIYKKLASGGRYAVVATSSQVANGAAVPAFVFTTAGSYRVIAELTWSNGTSSCTQQLATPVATITVSS